MSIMIAEYKQQQKFKVLKALLGLGSLFFVFYGALNLSDEIRIMSIVEFSFSIWGFSVLYRFDSWPTQKAENFCLVFINLLFGYLLFVLCIDGIDKGSHIWFVVIPITCYLLTGLKNGMLFSIFYLSMAILILSVREYFHPAKVDMEYMLDSLTPYLWVWLAAHIYEKASDKSQKALLNMAVKDPLTNLYNRRAFYDFFKKNKEKPIGLMIVDLDFFKAINDNYGHDAGDHVLKYVATKLSILITDNIKAFRIGGEEFAILLFNHDLEQTLIVADKLLQDISQSAVGYNNQSISVTASIGVATGEAHSELSTLTKIADNCLYDAKDNGRNRVHHTM